MDFSLDNFMKAHSWEEIEKFKKADLLTIICACKAELKETLCERLVERGVLSLQMAAVKKGRRRRTWSGC